MQTNISKIGYRQQTSLDLQQKYIRLVIPGIFIIIHFYNHRKRAFHKVPRDSYKCKDEYSSCSPKKKQDMYGRLNINLGDRDYLESNLRRTNKLQFHREQLWKAIWWANNYPGGSHLTELQVEDPTVPKVNDRRPSELSYILPVEYVIHLTVIFTSVLVKPTPMSPANAGSRFFSLPSQTRQRI